MTAPQDLTNLARRCGLGKVPQEALAAFAREVLAGQAAEVERLNAEAWGAAAHASALHETWATDFYTLYGYELFIGPCVHGRDPWDRCDECGEETTVHALLKVRTANKAEIERLKAERDEARGTADAFLADRSRAEKAAAAWAEAFRAETGKTASLEAENERLRSRLEETNREARAYLERAENAEVRLQQAREEIARLADALRSTADLLDSGMTVAATAFIRKVLSGIEPE